MSSYISTTQYPARFSTQNIPNEERINDFVLTYEIGEKFATKLPHLVDFKIVFVFDDSGSMNTKLNESPLNSAHEKATRWDELKHFAEICVGAANIFDEEGTDIYFLNRPTARRIHKIEELEPYMSKQPRGYTPLVNTMTKVFLDYEPMVLGGRKLLTIVVTDGEPTDDRGQVDINGFKKCLVSRPPYVYTNIVSCTDEDETMSYLNEWDRELQRLDVLDDYKSERDEIRAVQGKDFSFSLGDYIVKSLMGSIDSEIDDLDEIKL